MIASMRSSADHRRRRLRLRVGGGLVLAILGALVPMTSAAAPARTVAELQGTRRIALVIGVNDGGHERERLRYAGSDAKALSKVLSELGGVTHENRLVLDDPDVQGLRKGFEQIAAKVRRARAKGERVELLFYYSGHSDESGLRIGEELITYRELRQMIDALPADVRIAILDSCASGAFTRLKGGKKRDPFLIGGPSVKGHAFLTSSSADEAAQESDRIRGSFFTHYLVTGLRGAADVNRDRIVTLNEAYQFAFDETLARTEGTRGGPQHAAYEIQLAGSGDLVMTDLRESTATLEIAADIGGRVFIRDQQGNLEAELHKPKGSGTIALALEPGVYRITVDDGTKLWRASIRVAEGDSALLGQSGLKVIEAETTTLRGDPSPPPPTKAPPPPPKPTLVPFNIGLTSERSTNANHRPGPLTNHLSISVITGKVANVQGIAAALGATTVGEKLTGAQLAIGVANLEGEGAGLQASVGLSIAHRPFFGGQTSVIANVAKTELHGAQFTGLFNYANQLHGVQIAGIANHAREARGLQFGFVNTSGTLRGASFGVINVTSGRVEGLQFGLINFADDADVSIALLPISRKGGAHLDVWTSDLAALNIGLRLASRRTYTLLSAGIHPTGPNAGWLIGLGFGGRFRPTEKLFIDLDNTAYAVEAGLGRVTQPPTFVDSLRLMLGWQAHKRFSIYGGATANIALDATGSGHQFRPGYAYASYRNDFVTLWPGFVFGLSI